MPVVACQQVGLLVHLRLLRVLVCRNSYKVKVVNVKKNPYISSVRHTRKDSIKNDCLDFSAPFYFSIQLPMAVRCWSCILRDDTKELCWGTMSSNFANFRNVSLGSRSTRQNFHLSIQLPIAGTCNRLYGIRPSCLLPATRSPGSVEKRRCDANCVIDSTS